MRRKSVLSVLLAIVTACSLFGGVVACDKKEESVVDFEVKVESGRDARVLHISDPQLTDVENAEEYCYRYIRQVVGRYDPDLILVTGDLVYGQFDDDGSILLDYIKFMETLDTPWAPVFGNHDNESLMGADWQCEQLENAENCLFKQRELMGNGNYTVGIKQGGEMKRVFYMLDTNGCGNMSMASRENEHTTSSVGVQRDQHNWCKEQIEKVKEKYPNAKHSLAFHIQPYAFAIAMDAYRGQDGIMIRNLDEYEEARAKGDFGYIGAAAKGPWDVSCTAFYEFVSWGVDSIFVGHEHLNSWSITYKGVRLQYGQKCSQYDRYNKWIDGEIVGNYSKEGQAIMGGTKMDICKDSGEIKNAGLCLYDWTQA